MRCAEHKCPFFCPPLTCFYSTNCQELQLPTYFLSKSWWALFQSQCLRVKDTNHFTERKLAKSQFHNDFSDIFLSTWVFSLCPGSHKLEEALGSHGKIHRTILRKSYNLNNMDSKAHKFGWPFRKLTNEWTGCCGLDFSKWTNAPSYNWLIRSILWVKGLKIPANYYHGNQETAIKSLLLC